MLDKRNLHIFFKAIISDDQLKFVLTPQKLTCIDMLIRHARKSEYRVKLKTSQERTKRSVRKNSKRSIPETFCSVPKMFRSVMKAFHFVQLNRSAFP